MVAARDSLRSLRALDRALVREAWRIDGKSARDWILGFTQGDGSDVGEALTALVDAGFAATPALLEAVARSHPAPEVNRSHQARARCLQALWAIDPAPSCAIPVALRALDDPSARVRWSALRLLGRLGPQPSRGVLAALSRALGDERDGITRALAARAIGGLRGPPPPALIDALRDRLYDPVPRVRLNSARVLERVGDGREQTLAALAEIIVIDPDCSVAAISALLTLAPTRALAILDSRGYRRGVARDPRFEAWELWLLGQHGWSEPACARRLARATMVDHHEPLARYCLEETIRRRRTRGSGAPGRAAQDPRGAALCRPPAAVRRRGHPLEERRAELEGWLTEIAAWGPEARARAAIAAVRVAMPQWMNLYPDDVVPLRCLFLLERWVCEPTAELAAELERATDFWPRQGCSSGSRSAAVASGRLFTAGIAGDEDRGARALYTCALQAAWALSDLSVDVKRGLFQHGDADYEADERVPEGEALRRVRAAIRDELLPWHLGLWDPIRDPAAEASRWMAEAGA